MTTNDDAAAREFLERCPPELKAEANVMAAQGFTPNKIMSRLKRRMRASAAAASRDGSVAQAADKHAMWDRAVAKTNAARGFR